MNWLYYLSVIRHNIKLNCNISKPIHCNWLYYDHVIFEKVRLCWRHIPELSSPPLVRRRRCCSLEVPAPNERTAVAHSTYTVLPPLLPTLRSRDFQKVRLCWHHIPVLSSTPMVRRRRCCSFEVPAPTERTSFAHSTYTVSPHSSSTTITW